MGAEFEKEYDKEYNITKDLILEMLTKAIGDNKYFLVMRSFIFNYSYGIGHFNFASESEENFFILFSDYLIAEDTYGDSNLNQNLLRFRDGLLKYKIWSKELLLTYDCYDQIDKYYSLLVMKKIGYKEFKELVSKHCNVLSLDVNKVIDFFLQEKGVDKAELQKNISFKLSNNFILSCKDFLKTIFKGNIFAEIKPQDKPKHNIVGIITVFIVLLFVSIKTDNLDSFAGGILGAVMGVLISKWILNFYKEHFANFRVGKGFISNKTLQKKGLDNCSSDSKQNKS